MKILENFIVEFHSQSKKHKSFAKNLEGEVSYVKSLLLQEEFLPSKQLEDVLNKQIRRCHYPIEIAIVGQFSSGKSTFLNALLAKNILPVGITPVTSKVTYINYAQEYKFKVTYKSGAEKYLAMEEISKFTDQREELIENIKYLSIYAPIELLKEISFVDTPGLNSQSQSDTQETLKALNDVGGIIWLSLIDNAGKLSEEKILEKHMKKFKNKSLCILNQKDKFTQKQIEATQNYIQKKFSKYFTKVTPISAKNALESRAQQKDVLQKEEENNFINSITVAIKERNYTQEFYLQEYENYKIKLQNIQEHDYSQIVKMQEESNIGEVLDFITQVLQPQAKDTKEFVIKKDLQGICEILIQEYDVLIQVHHSLIQILQETQENLLSEFEDIKEIVNNDLIMLYDKFQSIIDEIASEIYKQVKESQEYFYKEKKSLLSSGAYTKKMIKSYSIDSDTIHKNLFFDEEKVPMLMRKLMKRLDHVYFNIEKSFEEIFKTIQKNTLAWQKPYELIKKNREIASDLEFSGTRHFASKVYENILQHYKALFIENTEDLHQKISYFQGNFENNSFCVVDIALHTLEERINESLAFHIKDFESFSVYHPRKEEIIKILEDGFSLDKVESFLISNRSHVKKTLKNTKDAYIRMNQDRIEFIDVKIVNLQAKKEKIQEIKENIKYNGKTE